MFKIKCRAWDKEEQIMIEWFDEFFADTSPVTRWGDSIDYERFIIMPYLYLWDDNYKEIYDGDIVKLQCHLETKTSYLSAVRFTPYFGAQVSAHPVHIKMGIGQDRSLYKYCSVGITEENPCTCEIVGNIYKNPDLILA